jgi:hypothetical protein
MRVLDVRPGRSGYEVFDRLTNTVVSSHYTVSAALKAQHVIEHRDAGEVEIDWELGPDYDDQLFARHV